MPAVPRTSAEKYMKKLQWYGNAIRKKFVVVPVRGE